MSVFSVLRDLRERRDFGLNLFVYSKKPIDERAGRRILLSGFFTETRLKASKQ
jgi:hypothetical protein